MFGLTVNPAKVNSATSHLMSFLGHIISPAGVYVDQDRTKAIREFPAPRDAMGIDQF
jgi:hypothetical protein